MTHVTENFKGFSIDKIALADAEYVGHLESSILSYRRKCAHLEEYHNALDSLIDNAENVAGVCRLISIAAVYIVVLLVVVALS